MSSNLSESEISSIKKKIIQECKKRDVIPTGVDVMGLRNFYIFLPDELSMYRIWDMYLSISTKGYSENLKTWYVHVITE